jgi:hypothetical protein
MAYEASSPLGISWGHLGLLLLPILLIASVVLAIVRRREIRSPWIGLLIVGAVASGLWTFFTVGSPVVVPIPGDPQGAECLMNPFGDSPEGQMHWDGDCGHGLARRLVISGAPSVVMFGITAGAIGQGVMLNRRRRTLVKL